jgi:hypothetical protein
VIDGLECCHCGIEVIESDADGQYWDGTCAICPECGCESRVIVDEHDDPPSAGVSTDDGAGGLVYAVRVERARWQAACLGFEPAPA